VTTISKEETFLQDQVLTTISKDNATLQVEHILAQSSGAVRAARLYRDDYIKKRSKNAGQQNHLLEETGNLLRERTRKQTQLLSQFGIMVNSLRGKKTFNKPKLNSQAQQWVEKMQVKSQKKFKRTSMELAVRKEKRNALLNEIRVSDIMIIAFFVDAFELALMILIGFKPKWSKFLDPVIVLSWWISGIVVMITEMNLSLVSGVYALSQIPTTVGFGDFCPQTPALKLWEAFHVFISSAVVAEDLYEVISFTTKKLEQRFNKKNTDMGRLIISAVELLVEISFSTAFYAWEFTQESDKSEEFTWEGEGNTEGGGYGVVDDLINALYMSVIASTTVGYGDYTPNTELGRVIMTPWMYVSSAAQARLAENWEKYRRPNRAASRRAGSRKRGVARMRAEFNKEFSELEITDPETGETHEVRTRMNIAEFAETALATTTTAVPETIVSKLGNKWKGRKQTKEPIE
jgi:hypothetical protein